MDKLAALLTVIVAAAIFHDVSAQEHDHHQHGNHEEHRVGVTVYYESLCSDSRKFFTQQLYPSLQTSLSQYINLTLVPYGKTKTTMQNSELHFECHHGPAECRGNKIQACAIRHIPNIDSSLGYNKVTVGFINCLMDKVDHQGDATTFPTTECAQVNNVNNLNTIENCANHSDSSNYLSSLGQQTDAFQKPLKSVPTIVFNGQYKAEDVSTARANFVKALCQYIEEPKPHECLKNGATSLSAGTMFLALTAVLFRYFF